MLDGRITHDKFTRFLAGGEWTSRDLWKLHGGKASSVSAVEDELKEKEKFNPKTRPFFETGIKYIGKKIESVFSVVVLLSGSYPVISMLSNLAGSS